MGIVEAPERQGERRRRETPTDDIHDRGEVGDGESNEEDEKEDSGPGGYAAHSEG